MNGAPLPAYTTEFAPIVVTRENIAKAVDILISGDGWDYKDNGYTREQLEQAAWHWLRDRIESLYEDLAEESHGAYSGFDECLERAALLRHTLEGTDELEVGKVSRTTGGGHLPFTHHVLTYRVGEYVEYANALRKIEAVHATEYGHQYLTLADVSPLYVAPELVKPTTQHWVQQ